LPIRRTRACTIGVAGRLQHTPERGVCLPADQRCRVGTQVLGRGAKVRHRLRRLVAPPRDAALQIVCGDHVFPRAEMSSHFEQSVGERRRLIEVTQLQLMRSGSSLVADVVSPAEPFVSREDVLDLDKHRRDLLRGATASDVRP
jgi:hypothetical protein